MNKTALIAATAAVLALSTPAFAQDNAAFVGVRAEVAAGVASVDSINTDNTVLSGTLGVDAPLNANWTIGAEATVTEDEAGVAARLGYAVSPRTLVFGRVGYADFDNARDFSNRGLALGAGIEHRLGERTFLTTQYRYTDFDQGDGAHGALIGLGYRF